MNILNEPSNSKETRIVEKYLLFPKCLYVNTKMAKQDYSKEIRCFKKVKIKQIARPHFYSSGLSIILTRFSWQDKCFVD